jgi:3-(3-hydroxy-phenyl)propionate hydroxylase
MEAPHDPDDRFFPMINLQQQYLEQYLTEAVLANPLIEMRWGNRVTRVDPKDGFVRVEVDTPEGPYSLESDWLVASDGARSGIRAMMDLKLEGASYEGRFVIADIRIDLPLPTERLAFFDPDWNPGNTILMHREPHGIWRVDYQLPADETPEQALAPESLKARIDAQLAMIGHGGTPWADGLVLGLFRPRPDAARLRARPRAVHRRRGAHAADLRRARRQHRLAGRAGMAWRLAFVVRGLAPESLLQSYSSERVAAAWEIIDEAGKSTRFMTPPTRGFRLLRDAVLSLSLSQPFVGPLYHWRTSRPHEYTHSPLNSAGDDNGLFKAGPGHGAPPQNIRLGADDYLLDHLGGGFDLLYFTDGPAIPEALRKVVAATRAGGVPMRVVAVGAAEPVAGADLTLADADGHFRQRYGVLAGGAAYLLRPDQHICARWMSLDAGRLQSALATALGGDWQFFNPCRPERGLIMSFQNSFRAGPGAGL